MPGDDQVYLNVSTPTDSEGPVVPPTKPTETEAEVTEEQNAPAMNDPNDSSVFSLDDTQTKEEKPAEPPQQEDDEHPHAHITIPSGDPLEQKDDELRSEERNPMPASYPEVKEEAVPNNPKPAPGSDPADDDTGLDLQDYPTFNPGEEDKSKATHSAPGDEIVDEHIAESIAREVSERVTDAALAEEKERDNQSGGDQASDEVKQTPMTMNLDQKQSDASSQLDSASIPESASMGSVVKSLESMTNTVDELRQRLNDLDNKIKETLQKVA